MTITPEELLERAGFADHVTVRKAQELHELECRTLVIKASPPVYEGTVAGIRELLAETFEATASDLVMNAADDLAAIAVMDVGEAAKVNLAKVRMAALEKALAEAGQDLPQDVREGFGRYLAVAYRLGQAEVLKPMGWAVDFALADRDALHGLTESGLYWIGERYGEALDSDKLRAIVRETMLEQGLGRVEAGRRLAKAFGDQITRSDVYWRGLAATVATRSRSFGAVGAMQSAGALRYEYINPMDERTSDVCAALDGKVFSVSGAFKLRTKLLEASSPEEWKAISPWPKVEDLTVDGTKDGKLLPPGALQAKGIAWPPLHFHCRSAVEVRVWGPMSADEVDPLADVELAPLKPPKVKPEIKPLPDHVPAPAGPPPWSFQLPVGGMNADDAWDITDWRAFARLNGYTDAELDAIFDWKKPAFLASGEPMTDAVDDVPAMLSWFNGHPPATPKAWSPSSQVMSHNQWLELSAVGVKGVSEDNASQFIALIEQVYTKEQIEALNLISFKSGKLKGVLSPWNKTHGELVEWIADNPPGSPKFAAMLAKGKVPKKAPTGTATAQAIPKPAKPPKAPPPPSKTVPKPPTTTATTAEQLGGTVGAVDVDAGYDWTVPTPPNGVAGTKSKATWKKWLQKQGYTSEEADALVPGLLEAMPEDPATAAAWIGKAGGAKVSAKAGAWKPHAVNYLNEHPPGSVVAMPTQPQLGLSPAELGQRLRKGKEAGPVGTWGVRYDDQVDGQAWFVQVYDTPEQARQAVVADGVYRKLGVEVPHSRLVELPDGKIGIARKKLAGWKTSGELSKQQLEELADTFAADAYLGNWNVTGIDGEHLFIRSTPGPGGKVMRIDQSGALEFRATGPKKALDGQKVIEFDSMLDPDIAPEAAQTFRLAAEDPARMLPMMDRISALSDAEIDQLVSLGGGPLSEQQRLAGLLKGRRKDITKRAKKIRVQAAQEAKARAAEQARRAEAGARRTALGLDRPPAQGLTLSNIDETTAVVGDAGLVSDQRVRVSRYRAVASSSNRKTVDAGFVVRMDLTEEGRAKVEKLLQKAGASRSSYRNYARPGFLNAAGKDDTAGLPELVFDRSSESVKWTSARGAWRLDNSEIQVDYIGSNGNKAVRGRFRIMVKETDPERAQEILEDYLTDLGLESIVDVPTAKARELARTNRALQFLEGPAYDQRPPKTLTEARRRLKAKGYTIDELQERVDSTGQTYDVIPGRHEKWRRDDKARFLYHEYSSGEVTNSIAGADGSAGGLWATTERAESGVIVSGASSTEDIKTGGATGVFLRVAGEKQEAGEIMDRWYGFGEHKVIVHPRVLDRTDWYGYASDEYGARRGLPWRTRQGTDALIESGRMGAANEVMPAGHVGVEDFLLMPAAGPRSARYMRSELRSAGFEPPYGMTIEEFVPIMRTPRDFSNLDPNNPVHRYIMDPTAPDPG